MISFHLGMHQQLERKQGVCATRRRRSKWEALSVTSYNNIIMVKKRSLSLPPPPYTLPPLLPVPNKPYGSVDVKHHLYLLMFSVGPANLQHCLSPTYLYFMSAPLTSNTVSALLTYVFCRPRIPPTLSQSYLLMFSVSPAYLQHCLSSTYLCFLSAPLTSNSVTAYLLMFSVGPAYLQHCLSPTYLCFLSVPLTSNTVSVLLTYVFSFGPAYLQHCLSPTYLCFFLRPRLPPTLSVLLTYVFFLRPRLPPTLSQSYLLVFFSFGPAYLQHCLIPTYLCFFPSAPLTSS